MKPNSRRPFKHSRAALLIVALAVGSTFSAQAQDPVPFHPFAQLLNISTRARVGLGQNVLIGGFIIQGTEPKRVVVRAIGPSLGQAGVPDALTDPVLELRSGAGILLSTNDDWKESQQAEIEAAELAPSDDHESAILQQLPPGAYTAIVRGKGDATGVALVEIYDIDQNADSVLANLSSRAWVENDDNPLIGGVIIGGRGGPFNMVVVRAGGPSLSAGGIENVIDDPVMELHAANGEVVESNDNWRDGVRQEFITTKTLAPTDDNESAIATLLAPGAYTAIVRGRHNASGIALVEFYNLR